MKAIGLPLGISFTFWAAMGLLRLITQFFTGLRRKTTVLPYTSADIAVIVPAHNEEMVIRRSIQFLKKSLNKKQIYVVSDGSSDKTYAMARKEKVHVAKLNPGRGKARALVYTLNKFHLFEKYKLIFIVDADTNIDTSFIPNALKLFEDPGTVAVFGSARIRWPQHFIPSWKYYLISYRERLNRTLQYFLIYGQTWRYTNVSFVVPGFATIYKSDVLKQLEIDTPNLLIEDFNLAFQVHKRKLGKIGYSPSMIGWDQHPDNLYDYWKQVRRWNIGFYQTVKMNKIWPSFFWLSLLIFSAEVLLNSLLMFMMPFLLLYLLADNLDWLSPVFASYHHVYLIAGPYKNLSLATILIAILLFDYIVTVIIGLINKKPQFAFYGLFFFFMHYVTSLILISSIIPGFFGKSDGRWISPKRRLE
ncbi:MAG TPA: glycosyltransferase [Candidatus Saccharimonadales bacterium]|nr:glycosyltransferase [Candidatus Saccharimonadales bacterium]